MASGEGVVVIGSSRDSETSWIMPGDPTSLFTKHVVAGLRGAGGHDSNGFVRVFDLFNHVAEMVRNERPDQAPVYAAHHQDSNFAVAYCAVVDKRVELQNLSDYSSNEASILNLFVDIFSNLYPLGPTERDIWFRSGGDLSRLVLSGNGRTQWLRTGREIERGSNVTFVEAIDAALKDYPMNRNLRQLRARSD